jgi:hypothetical protein
MPACWTDAPNFVSIGVRPKIKRIGSDGDTRNRRIFHKIHNRHQTTGSCDIRVTVQVRSKKGWPMLAKQDNEASQG